MLTLLLLTASMLGFLAYFEPCTIANHTLYSVNVHRANQKACCQRLFAIWLSRSLLLILLFLMAVSFIEPTDWGAVLPIIALAVMAAVYVISRFVYIPVPHLAFYKLLPRSNKLPYSIQLGLTLPACTLPLVIIVGGMAVAVNSISFAALSALLFSTLFTLPMVLAALKGFDKDSLDLLNRAALATPYITAIVLLALASYLTIPLLGIDSDKLKTVFSQASLYGIGLSFIAGFVFSFNPVSFASIPVVLAYVTKAHEQRRALLMGTAFITGMIITHVALGVAAALGGEWVQGVMGRQWGLVLGPILIIMGLMWAGWLRIKLPWFGMKATKVTGILGAFLLGIPFSVAVCPFCTPALLVALTSSAAIGSVSFGFFLLLAFALGRSIPVMLGAWSMGWLESLNILSRQQKALEILAGIALVITGFYMLNEYYFII